MAIHMRPAYSGTAEGSAALERQIEDLTVDLSAFTCDFFRVEVMHSSNILKIVHCVFP